MKKVFALPLAALFLAACSEPTASSATSAPSLRPSAVRVAGLNGYSDDFESNVGAATASEWNFYNVGTIPASSDYSAGHRGYLGPWTNEDLKLTYDNFHPTSLTFDLYIIGTWDGIASKRYGADTWRRVAFCGTAEAGTVIAGTDFTTSFSNK